MNIESIKIMYFLGVGGIGMSALARYCQSLGIEIHGYDLVESEITNKLIAEGMKLHFHEDISMIPNNVDMVIYTPAVPIKNKEYLHFKENNIDIVKRSELLGLLSKKFFTIAVAGTHGKTSISTIITHLLISANKNVTALIGGLMNNYNSNAVISKETDLLVLEADEFDKSFLRLEPNISVISSMDDDHFDIYQNSSDLTNAFTEFALKTPKDGLLIYYDKLNKLRELDICKVDYGFDDKSDTKAIDVQIVDDYFKFSLQHKDILVSDIKMQIPGRHYIENALAASRVALECGLNEEEIKYGLETFSGVERRFDYRIKNTKTVYIDDYAHHPTEIFSTIDAVRELYPKRKLTVIFQPHLYSRTRDFVDDFAKSLNGADDIILLDIYPARELPMEGVSSSIILDRIENRNKVVLSKEEAIKYIETTKPELLLSLGAGDIGLMVKELELALR